ncbi:hypothetical protein NK718_19120 [Alsobacter sp. SYSU M60028]|uniref:Uncharacterized protein n=1 Tax=Alsobacter ponti TaxID=2962936 RepID=A0ABT1LGL4_9HYPH|nr:hypothetical protein [Alsobacter ponti]MCP8940642.1 hypothetical protein [Alsobacter ponti]
MFRNFLFCSLQIVLLAMFIGGQSYAKEDDLDVVQWRNFDQKDRAYLTVAHGYGGDAYTGPSLDCQAGQRDVRMWIAVTREQLAFAAEQIKQNEPIGLMIVSRNFEKACPKERLEYWRNEMDENWELQCEMPINEGEDFFNAFVRSGVFGLKFGSFQQTNSNAKGRPSIRAFQKFCLTSKHFSFH